MPGDIGAVFDLLHMQQIWGFEGLRLMWGLMVQWGH